MPKLLETAPRILLHAVVWLLVMAAKCFGVEPDIKVNCPEHVLVGQILTLSFDESKGDNLKFKVTVEPPVKGLTQWKHDEPTATKATIATFPGRWRVRVQAFNADGIDEWERIIQLPGDPPTPQPGPDIDPPGPVPPEPNPPAPNPPTPPDAVPVGEFGIAPKVAGIVRKITDPAKAATGKTLADAADAIAAQIAAGTLTGVNELLTKIGESIKATNNPAWQAAAAEFSKELSAVYEANKRGKLAVSTLGGFKEPAGWSTLMREVAVGVRAGVK